MGVVQRSAGHRHNYPLTNTTASLTLAANVPNAKSLGLVHPLQRYQRLLNLATRRQIGVEGEAAQKVDETRLPHPRPAKQTHGDLLLTLRPDRQRHLPPSLGTSNNPLQQTAQDIQKALSLGTLSSLVARLSALIAYNGVGASVGEMARLLAVVAHGLVLAVAGDVARLLAAVAHHVVLAVAGNVAGLQAAEAQIAGTESARLAPGREERETILLGAVASDVAGLVAVVADHLGLLGSGGGSVRRSGGGLSGLLPTHDRPSRHSRSGLFSRLLGGAATSSVVRSALGGERGRTTSHSSAADNHASPPSGAAGFSGQSRAM